MAEFRTRDEALAAWDALYATRPAWLEELKIEGIAWYVAQAGEPGDEERIMDAETAVQFVPIVPGVVLAEILEDHPGELSQYRQLADASLIWAKGLIITDAEGLGAAIAKLGEVVQVGKKADVARKKLLSPARGWIASLEARFMWVVGPVKEAEGILRKKVEAWQTAERDRLAQEQRDREAAARQAQIDVAAADKRLADARVAAAAPPVEETGTLVDLFTRPAMPPPDVKQAEANLETARRAAEQAAQVAAPAAAPAKTVVMGGTTATMREDMTYEVTDLAKVPRAFLVPDAAKIRAAIAAGAREIDGLRIFPKPTLVVGTKR